VPLHNGVSIIHGGAVYTVFSASNYCGTSNNLGAVVIFGHGADRPTDTYQWDPRTDASMSKTVVSKRKGKEIRRKAAVHQAAEYIIENKTALLEYFKRGDKEGKGTVTFFQWAQGMAQVRLALPGVSSVAWNIPTVINNSFSQRENTQTRANTRTVFGRSVF
jgi:serine/threonine-protein phosphatase with EF-hand domain